MSSISPADRSGMTPREVFELKQRLIVRMDIDGQADLFAEGGVMEIPFSASGLPLRIEGREHIRRLTKDAVAHAMTGTRRPIGHGAETIYETSDPEVIVAEFTARTEDVNTGEVREAPYIQVLRCRNGEIVSFRDYCTVDALTYLWGHSGEEAFAGLEEGGPAPTTSTQDRDR